MHLHVVAVAVAAVAVASGVMIRKPRGAALVAGHK